MEIRIRATGAVMFESELHQYLKDNDGPSFDVLTPEVMELLGVDPVLEGPQAQPTRYQVAFRDGVEQIDGQWFTKYSVSDMTKEAKSATDKEKAFAMRAYRDLVIAKSDWRVIKALESNIPQDFAWAQYRQELRDVTAQSGFPWSIVWPTEPV